LSFLEEVHPGIVLLFRDGVIGADGFGSGNSLVAAERVEVHQESSLT